jgi:hypothetical protein
MRKEQIKAREYIEIIQGWLGGKTIQLENAENNWSDIHGTPTWDFAYSNYRIKPEPLECWVNVYSNESMCVYSGEKEAKCSPDSSVVIVRRAVHMKEVRD